MSKIELEGMDYLIDRVNKLGDKGVVIKKNALSKAAEFVKETMQKLAPKSKENKTHMADNIRISDIENEDGTDFIEIGPQKGDITKFFYSKFTEWGTTKIPAQHWAHRSILKNKKKINKVIEKELKRALEE